MRRFGLFAATGAAISYFLDPDNGRRRRAVARDRSAGFVRQTWRRLGRVRRAAQAEAYGLTKKAQHLREEPKPTLDDTTLAHKVETEIFRDIDVPKGQINVNAENGIVVLRGEVGTAEMIRDLEDRARQVQGVQKVENLLHLPGTTAQMHERH
jgi:osmotically-inducible protein OsmY